MAEWQKLSEIVLELKHSRKKFSRTGAGTARTQHAGQQPSAAKSGVKSKTEVVADGSEQKKRAPAIDSRCADKIEHGQAT